MDTYIIRVLRREKTQDDKSLDLHGVVETADSHKRQAFHSADQLWALLLSLEETEHYRHHDE